MDNWDPKPARTSPYDGTEPVLLLRPEDMHASPNHQPNMRSLIDLVTYSCNNDTVMTYNTNSGPSLSCIT